MTSNEVSFVDVVRALDGAITETDVGDSYATSFLGVVLEVSLYIFICVVTDVFDGVFVSTNSTVAAETPEFALDCTSSCCIRSGFFIEREVCNVVFDTDCELSLRSIFAEFFINF